MGLWGVLERIFGVFGVPDRCLGGKMGSQKADLGLEAALEAQIGPKSAQRAKLG